MIEGGRIVKLFGPPGTGKTHRLLDIMERELAIGVKPTALAYLTFTKAARREAKARAMAKFGYGDDDLPFFRTLHSVAFMQLGVVREGLLRSTEMLAPLGERLGVEFSLSAHRLESDVLEFGNLPGDQMLAMDHLRRHRLQTPAETFAMVPPGDVSWYEFDRFVRGYEAWKQEETLLDFTDLLTEPLRPLPIEVAIVDEAQDLSRLQWLAVECLTQNAKRIYLAGDDDQAIYTWAGADAAAFLEQEGKPAFLEQSHRLPRRVLERATMVLERIKHRQPKPWRPRDADGAALFADEFESVVLPTTGSVLVLYRNHYMARQIAETLLWRGVPFTARDLPGPGLQWLPAIETWERLLMGAAVSRDAAQGMYDAIASQHGIQHGGKAKLERADAARMFTRAELAAEFGLTAAGPWHNALTRIPVEDREFIQGAILAGRRDELRTPRVRLSTIHAAKGAEADHVVLMTGMARRVREGMEQDPDAERRVWYVGATRAKETLTIVGLDEDDLGLA